MMDGGTFLQQLQQTEQGTGRAFWALFEPEGRESKGWCRACIKRRYTSPEEVNAVHSPAYWSQHGAYPRIWGVFP